MGPKILGKTRTYGKTPITLNQKPNGINVLQSDVFVNDIKE
jgi:hypothetical protein